MEPTRPRRPATRAGFEIAVICALPIEADAVDALFDDHWDDNGPPYDKVAGDPNAYSTGAVGRHNVVLAHMPGMGKASAAAVAAHCRASFPNIKLALVTGICGVVPFRPAGSGATAEIVLGDVIVSDGVVQYDLGQRLPEQFAPKDTLLDALGRPNAEIRALLAKLKGLRSRKMLQGRMAGYMDVLRGEPELAAVYPGAALDRLFEATYRHVSDGKSCDECGCDGELVPRARFGQGDGQPAVHFGLIGSGDTVMKSGEDRDTIARQADVIGFEMEGAGVWDSFPCLVIKSACDYADSHKTEAWQRYAAAAAAACMKAFLGYWVPSTTEPLPLLEQPAGPWFLVPYIENTTFIGRESILKQLQQQLLEPTPQSRIALFGLGGVGKTQIALAYAYWLRRTSPEVSVFWVHASSAERFRQAYASIAQECQVPGYDDPKADVLVLVKAWLERKDRGGWLMVFDNADDLQLFFGQHMGLANASSSSHEESLGRYLPECSHGVILVTTRNKQTGSRLAKGNRPIEVGRMDDEETAQLLRARLGGIDAASDEFSALSSRLEHLPLALAQAAAFIQENTITICDYLQLLDEGEQNVVDLLSEEFETDGRDSETPRAVAETWILSFEQIQRLNGFAGELLSLMSLFDRQAIPLECLSYYSKQQGQEKRGGIQLTKALGVLKAFCFVVEDKDHTFDMHRLVQLVTQKWLDRKGTMRQFAEQALLVVSQAYPYGSYENRAICSALLPHAYAVLRLVSTGSKDERVARASLLHCAAGFFSYQGQWDEAEKLQLQARGLRREVLGEEHPDTLASMINLASTFWNQGRWKEAEELQSKELGICARVLGEEHPDTLSSMGNLASTFWNQGRWKEAESLEVQVIETRKRVLGEEHPDTLSSMGNLASTYRNQGRWKEAESLEVQVVETSKRVLGEEHPHTLSSMANLAQTWKNQARLEDALDLMKTCFYHQQQGLGRDHPDTVPTLLILKEWQEQDGNAGSSEKIKISGW